MLYLIGSLVISVGENCYICWGAWLVPMGSIIISIGELGHICRSALLYLMGSLDVSVGEHYRYNIHKILTILVK